MVLIGLKIQFENQFGEDVIKIFNEDSYEGYLLEVGVPHLEELHELHNNLSFLPEQIKIEKNEKVVIA